MSLLILSIDFEAEIVSDQQTNMTNFFYINFEVEILFDQETESASS
jgi:hypothetical protein